MKYEGNSYWVSVKWKSKNHVGGQSHYDEMVQEGGKNPRSVSGPVFISSESPSSIVPTHPTCSHHITCPQVTTVIPAIGTGYGNA